MDNSLFDALTFLAIVGFLSNIVPGSLEVVLTVFLHKYANLALWGWFIAFFFNALGSSIIFLIGNRIPNHKTFSKRTEYLIHKYGACSLLLSGIPFIGDLLPIAAGWFKLKIIPSIVCIFIGKGIRYGLMVIFLEYVMHKI